jgi:hypothetical protein
MFVFIQKDLINVNHIVSCTTGSGVTLIILDTGRRLTIPAAEFEADVLPLLPLLKAPAKELPILPPEEVQVAPVTEEVPKVMSEIPAKGPQEAKPRSRSRKCV